jgi:hypothetical protein
VERDAEAEAEGDDEQNDAEEDDDNNDMAEDDGDNAVPRSIWKKFFVLIGASDDAPAHYSCLLPPETVSGNRQTHRRDIKKTGGSSNLRRHMKSTYHAKALAKFKEKIGAPTFMAYDKAAQEVIDEMKVACESNSVLTQLMKRQRTEGDAAASQMYRELMFVCFQISKGLSFSTADDPYLAAFVESSQQQQLPDRKRIANTLLPLMYNLVVSDRAVKWSKVDFFSITTDGWTSVAQAQYVAITIHFVSDWRLHSMLLDLVPLSESHNWQNLTRAVALRIQNLLPPTATLVCTVTDNG